MKSRAQREVLAIFRGTDISSIATSSFRYANGDVTKCMS